MREGLIKGGREGGREGRRDGWMEGGRDGGREERRKKWYAYKNYSYGLRKEERRKGRREGRSMRYTCYDVHCMTYMFTLCH